MKNIKYIIPALALSFASFASVAATQIQHAPATGLNETFPSPPAMPVH